jgi:lipopolysaccharide transport system permease protein
MRKVSTPVKPSKADEALVDLTPSREVGAVAGADAAASSRVGAAWVENRPSTGWFPRVNLRELWAYRELALVLALKDLKVRYKQTFFGVAWALLQPLLGVLVFSVFLGRLAGVPSDGIPYPVFVYAGFSIWIYFATSMTAAVQSLVDNRELVTKVYFPRLLAPFAAVFPGLLDLVIALGILAVFMAVYGVVPGAAIVLFPAWIFSALVLALAVGLWLSALNVKYRDVRYALGFLVQVWLFASPVVFASSLIHGTWQYAFAANPMVAVLDGFRWSLTGAPPPGLDGLISLAVGLVILASGTVYFRRVERGFADVI